MEVVLKQPLHDLLIEVAARHSIKVKPVHAGERRWQLGPQDREWLLEVITSEFTSTGLGPDDEPNARGLLLEELLDRLNDRTSNEKRREMLRQLELAEQGDAHAQNIIAAKLAQGYYVRQDLSGALYWYAQAVKQGHTVAKWNAGTMLLQGEGLSAAHVQLGMQLIEQAAQSGETTACSFLADCFEQGAYEKQRDLRRSAVFREMARRPERFVAQGAPFDIEASVGELSKPQIRD